MIFDADAHVEESEETFARLAAQPELAERPDLVRLAPRVVEGAGRGLWMIEGKLFPKVAGEGVFTFGTPRLHTGETYDPARRTHLESQELSDPAARLADMDQEGIDVSVLFPTLFLTWPVAEDRLLARALCRTYNAWLAEKCRATDGRLRFVATVPLPDVEGAVEELRHAKELGAVGVLLLGTAGEWLLDDRRLDPFYAEAERLGLPLCVHVGWGYPPLTRPYDNIFRSQILPFVVPVFMAFVSMVAGGVLDRFPRLKVGFFEAGVEWLPYWIDRVDRLFRQPPGNTLPSDLPERPPMEYLRSGNLYFSCELDEKRLPMVTETIGDDYIVYASDLPHAHRVFNAIQLFRERSDLPDATKEKILGLNARRFFGL